MIVTGPAKRAEMFGPSGPQQAGGSVFQLAPNSIVVVNQPEDTQRTATKDERYNPRPTQDIREEEF